MFLRFLYITFPRLTFQSIARDPEMEKQIDLWMEDIILAKEESLTEV
jgi:hypothetical protein